MLILFYRDSRIGELISANIHINEVLKHLTRQGHRIIFANGAEYHNSVSDNNSVISKTSSSSSLWARLKKYVDSLSFSGEARILLYTFQEVRLFFMSFITILCNKPDLIYRRLSLAFGSQYLLSRIFKIPCVIEVNGIVTDEVKMRKKANSMAERIIYNIEKRNLQNSSRLIAVTPKLKEVIHRDYGIAEDKIDVIENGANTDIFKPLDKGIAQGTIGLNKDAVYLCFTGIFYRWQGVENFIKAMPYVLKTHPDAKALLVGDGEMTEQLIYLTENLGIKENVIFTGRITYENVPLYINASDICVVPKTPLRSGYSPLKLCEYMACSKPVVATRTSGFELLEEIQAGLLVNPEEPQEFAQTLTGLLEDPVLRQTMGENGRTYVVRNRSWESVAKKVADVCGKAIKYREKPKK